MEEKKLSTIERENLLEFCKTSATMDWKGDLGNLKLEEEIEGVEGIIIQFNNEGCMVMGDINEPTIYEPTLNLIGYHNCISIKGKEVKEVYEDLCERVSNLRTSLFESDLKNFFDSIYKTLSND